MTLLDDRDADYPAAVAEASGTRQAARRNGSSPGSTLAGLLRRIAPIWPELRSSDARLIEEGGDHLIIVFDDNVAVRAPRNPGRDMTLEGAVLRALRGRIGLEIPAYDVSPDGRLARYCFIGGVPLTPERFAAMAPADRRTVGAQLGAFLSELHGMLAEDVAPEASWPRRWTAAEFADHARREILPALSLHAPSLMGDLERFYRVYEQDELERLVVAHGDLVHEHLLLRPGLDALAGIIDFGDVSLGDPAQDFAGLWAYGEAFVKDTLSSYQAGHNQKLLSARSKRAYLGNLVHRLGTAIVEKEGSDGTKLNCAAIEQIRQMLLEPDLAL